MDESKLQDPVESKVSLLRIISICCRRPILKARGGGDVIEFELFPLRVKEYYWSGDLIEFGLFLLRFKEYYWWSVVIILRIM